jgi:mercuric ion binding protein
MRIINVLTLFSAMAWLSVPAYAEEQTATLKVENMTCASCPYQVKKSLTGVEGVASAEVSLETKQAVVTFDDARTNIAALTVATANAGFPSQPVVSGEAANETATD